MRKFANFGKIEENDSIFWAKNATGMTRHPKRRYSRPLKSARNLNRHFPRVKKFCPATSNFHISGSRRDISVIFFSNSLKNCADFHYNYCCIGSKTKMQLSYGCKSICYCCTILVSDGPLCDVEIKSSLSLTVNKTCCGHSMP